MRLTKVSIALVAFGLLGLNLDAQTRRFTLNEAQVYAITHSQMAQSSKLDLAAAEATVKQTLARGLPQISGGLNYQQFIELPTQLIPAEFFGGEAGEFAEVQFGTKYNTTGSLNLNQLIFDGTYIVGLRATTVYRKLAQQSSQITEREIKEQVADTYYLILVAEENKKILSQTQDNLAQALFEITKLYEEGFVEETEKDQMALTLNQVKTNLSRIDRQIITAYELFKFQLGIDYETDIGLTDNLEAVMNAISPEMLMLKSLELETHIDYQMAMTNSKFMKLGLRKEQMANLPSISLNGSYQEAAQRNSFNFFDDSKTWYPTTVFGVGLNIPLFSSGLRYQTTKLARIEYERALLNEKFLAEQLKLREKQTRDAFLTAADNFNNEETNMALALKIFNTSLIKYREGLITGIELNQSHNQLLEIQGRYLASILDYLQSKTDFEKAINAL